MTKYEKTLDEANKLGLSVKEKELKSNADDEDTFNRIMKNKEKLLSFEDNLRFIFYSFSPQNSQYSVLRLQRQMNLLKQRKQLFFR